nr:unnamed protein product [Digitaria exilis]
MSTAASSSALLSSAASLDSDFPSASSSRSTASASFSGVLSKALAARRQASEGPMADELRVVAAAAAWRVDGEAAG